MTIGQRIAQRRKEKGLSQEALGTELGVSRQSVYKWESDSALPEIDKLITLSRLFGVTVGWLLGVEESGAPIAEQDASGELTERQLQMVEEIVDRYLAAQPPRKRRRWLWAAWAAVCAAALVTLGSMRGELRDLREQYGYLQNAVGSVSYNVNSQIGGIANRVEEILKSQNNLTASYGVEILSADLAANTITFSACAAPKTYTEGMEAVFTLDSGGGPLEFPGELGEDLCFRAEMTSALTDSITVSVAFLGGGVRQTQVLESWYGLYLQSMPEVDLPMGDSLLMWADLDENGQLVWDDAHNNPVVFVRPSSRIAAVDEALGRSEAEEVRVGLFRNRELVSWLEPCEKPENYSGFDGCLFYRLPDTALTPEEEDRFTVATVVRDEYGREEIYPGPDFSVDYSLRRYGQLAYADEGYPDVSLEDWTY